MGNFTKEILKWLLLPFSNERLETGNKLASLQRYEQGNTITQKFDTFLGKTEGTQSGESNKILLCTK